MSFAFWQDSPLDPVQVRLLTALGKAHHESALRGNISSQSVHFAAHGSRDFARAVAAGLVSIGGPDAPLERTVELLSAADPVEAVEGMLERKEKVPGWGNSFVRGEPDPIWSEVDARFSCDFPAISGTISSVTAYLHSRRRNLYPNPSAYTAAAAIAVGLPAPMAAYLFIAFRLSGWGKIIQAALSHN